jgi:trigger factor
VGTLDGVAFAGGTGDRDLTIGSKTFIDGFESGLIGAKVGETVDLNLTFPEDYHSKDLAGKAVVFTVTINYLCGEVVVPEFDDEMAKELGYKDEAEMREDMLKSLQEAKTASVDGKFGNDVWELAVANAEILKVNQEIYDYYYDSMLARYEGTAGQYMMTLDEYLKLGGMEKEAFDSMLDKYAIQCMEQELVLRAIVKAESLTVSEDEYHKALNDFYTKYKGQFADAAALEAYYGRERFENELLWNKVIAKVMESGIPVKATGEAATESAQ